MKRSERRHAEQKIKASIKRRYPWIANDPRRVAILMSCSGNEWKMRYTFRERRDAIREFE